MKTRTSTAADRLGVTVGGRWRLDRVLGAGASAAVYAATDPAGHRAAVKVLHEDIARSGEVWERFVREATLIARLDHPAIVRLLDHDTRDPETAYIAMELLEGETLGERASRLGTLPIPELLALAEGVLDALAAAHAVGVVHRDLKPDNIFLPQEGGVRLLDFGVARLLEPGTGPGTRLGLALGTAAYMAPEQALGQSAEIDARTDLFALGAILFRLISGQRVHEAATATELIAAMATRPAPRFATVCPSAPAHVAALIDLSLGFDRNARYPDARTMQDDVRAVRAGLPPPHATRVLAATEQATFAPGGGLGENPGAAAGAAPASAIDDESAPGDPAAALVGKTVAARYRVDHLLGTGGMGAVYRAEHVHMRKAIALKVLHRELTVVPEIVARFEREAVAASRIDHPNVVTATDFGRLEDGSFYLALEYVEGRSLRSLLDTEGALSPPRAARIAHQIAVALAAAHAQGIVHRDLKPDNVMLVARPENPEHVKVLDFGIAKVSGDLGEGQNKLTQFGSVFGTPEYMSPEQAMGVVVDPRADLYALGIVLYEMLAGATPFHADDLMAVLTQQLTAPPPPLPSAVPAPLTQLVAELLEKKPEARPANSAEVAARLEPLGAATLADGAMAPAELAFTPTLAHLPRAPLPPGSPRFALRAPTAAEFQHWHAELQRWSVKLRGFLELELLLGGRRVPLWMPLAAASLLLGMLFVLLVTGSRDADGTQPGDIETAASAGGPSGVLGRWLSSVVDPAQVVAAIEARPESERSATDWRTLAVHYAAQADHGRALTATGRALAANPSLAGDPALGRLVRTAVDRPEHASAALGVAARMGSQGADLLYDVWQQGQTDPALRKVVKLAESHLDDSEVRAHASPALAVALELRPGKTCNDYRKLMPDALAHADERAVPQLSRLAKKELCRVGRLGLKQVDCWACLRTNDDLTLALEHARATPAPRFEATASPP